MTALAMASYQLCWRAVRETIRQPGVEVSNLFIPLFFFFVTVGAISNVAGPAFGVRNYEGFQLPVAVLQGVAGSASISGIVMIRDIESGYFDKLLLTPSPRLAIVLGRLIADGIRATAFTAVILLVVSLAGSGMAAGPLGYVVILALAGLFGAAYSGIGVAIGLRSSSRPPSRRRRSSTPGWSSSPRSTPSPTCSRACVRSCSRVGSGTTWPGRWPP